MFTMVAESTRKAVSAAAAVAIVSFGGLVMDQAYLAAAPRGTIEIGELTALKLFGRANGMTMTPGNRTSRPCSFPRSWWLPSASRAWSRKKTAARSFRLRRSAPDSEGALLK